MRTLKKRKWTAFFLVKSVDDTIGNVVTMLNQLMAIRFPGEVAVILCVNFNRKNLEALRKQDMRLIVRQDPAPEFTTVFFKITTVDSGHWNRLEEIAEKKDFDITEEKDLAEFFSERVLRWFQAKRYLLFTWDHGDGFNIFSGLGQGRADTAGETPLVKNQETPALTMEELSQAICRSLKSKKIHVVIMMNCYMQVFDTGYALRHHVKYLIAPQTGMEFTTYDYPAIFSYLARKPGVSPKKLSAFVIRSFRKRAERTGAMSDDAISVCRLKYFDEMAVLIDQLAVILWRRLPADFQVIRCAFRKAHLVEDLKLLDLYSLFSTLTEIATHGEKAIIDRLFLLRNRIVYRKYIGPLLFAAYPDANKIYNGISILSPIKKPLPVFIKAMEGFFMSSLFLDRSVWGKLFRELELLDSAPSDLPGLAAGELTAGMRNFRRDNGG